MQNDSLDMRSPYIKNSLSGIEEMRERINNRNNKKDKENSNFLDFKKDDMEKESSDTLLRQKIVHLSKKVVGEEIKKFAEVASKEISQEFQNLEKRITDNLKDSVQESVSAPIHTRIDHVEQNIYDYLSTQTENINSIEEGLGQEIDSKINILNEQLSKLENRIKELEIPSFNNTTLEIKEDLVPESPKVEKGKGGEEDKVLNLEISTPISSTKDEEEDREKKDIKENIENRKNKEKKLEDLVVEFKSEAEKEEEFKFINDKIKSISKLFEKDGLLFKKNNYLSKIKDLEAEDILEKKDSLKNIDEQDKEKIYDILIDLVEKYNLKPKDDEKIEEFLQRLYKKEFSQK